MIIALRERILEVYFYRNANGSEPVREWLKSMPICDKKILGENIKTVQFGWPLGMPLVRNLGQGLWEVRSTLTGNRTARIIFFVNNKSMILANGFIKKSQKTPHKELELAHKRMRKYFAVVNCQQEELS